MKTLTFVRHGQSVANAGGITMAHDVIPLSPLGWAQAEKLAALLPAQPSAIFASAYLRAQETARPYSERVGVPVQIHPALHEFSNLDPALLAGLNGEQRQPHALAYWQAADPNQRMGEQAETFAEFSERVTGFLPELAALPADAVLFGHGMWLGHLAWQLLGFPSSDSLGMKAFRRFQGGLPMPNCAVYHLQELAPGQWRVQANEALLRELAQVA
ncbi:MAG: histidine phosphatase family protein [Janthinobacterium lividum]